MKIIHRNDSIHTGHTRDAALRRLRQANRWMIAGSAVLTGVLADAAANAFPGHTVTKRSGAKAPASSARKAHKALTPPAAPPKASTEDGESTQSSTQSSQPNAPAEETQQAQSEPQASAEAPRSESSAPAETSNQPAEQTQQPAQEAAPPVEERSEPVVSGGS
jgi:hypothetical protein